MEKIASFCIDHTRLLPGLYLSRQDRCGDCVVSTFDIRITAPNREPVIDQPALHTIEHLAATWLRNCEIKDRIVYFGPMGCRTGCYLLVFGDCRPEEIEKYVSGAFGFIVNYEGDIPGAKEDECGNYLEQNLGMAKYYAKKYLEELRKNKRFVYPVKGD